MHFGVGGFHRAHQAMYVDALMNAGQALDWGITGVGLLPGDQRMHDVLHAQDCLYTLVQLLFLLKSGEASTVNACAPSPAGAVVLKVQFDLAVLDVCRGNVAAPVTSTHLVSLLVTTVKVTAAPCLAYMVPLKVAVPAPPLNTALVTLEADAAGTFTAPSAVAAAASSATFRNVAVRPAGPHHRLAVVRRRPPERCGAPPTCLLKPITIFRRPPPDTSGEPPMGQPWKNLWAKTTALERLGVQICLNAVQIPEHCPARPPATAAPAVAPNDRRAVRLGLDSPLCAPRRCPDSDRRAG